MLHSQLPGYHYISKRTRDKFSSPKRSDVVMGFIIATIELLLSIRGLLIFFQANTKSVFSIIIYALTFPIMLPFRDLFPQTIFNRVVFDWSTLFAMIMYPFIFLFIEAILRMKNKIKDPLKQNLETIQKEKEQQKGDKKPS